MTRKTIALLIIILTLVCCVGVTGFAEGETEDEFPVIPVVSEEPVIPVVTEEPVITEAPIITEAPVITAEPTIAPTAAPVLPVITKNPAAETVKSGEGCIFVAKAENYSTIIWYFTKAGETVYMGDAAAKFPGLKVSGDGTEVLSLESVPDSLNGWNVGAVFVNANGKQGTATCPITVTPKASPSPSATVKPSASPTLKPMVTATPAVTVSVVTATPFVSLSPVPTEEVGGGRGGISFGLLLVTLLAVAVLGGAVVVFILYRSGRLELGGLFSSKSKNNGADRYEDDEDDDDLDDDDDDYRTRRSGDPRFGGRDDTERRGGNSGYRGRH